MKSFRDLKVWEKSHALALEIYRTTRDFPKEERYELASQLRSCSCSIPANIAEGCGRGSDPEFARFLQIAMGSASELEYHLLFARDLGILKEDVYSRLDANTTEFKRMLASLIASIRRDQGKRQRRQSQPAAEVKADS